MFKLFKAKPSWRQRHKLQDQYHKIADSHGYLLDGFDEIPGDPWSREINFEKTVFLRDWNTELQGTDLVYHDVSFNLSIQIWSVRFFSVYRGELESHEFKDDSFCGSMLKFYEEIWMDQACKIALSELDNE